MRTYKHRLFFALIFVFVGLNWVLPMRKVYAQEAKQEGINIWVQKLKDKSPDVRGEAASVLGEIKDARAVELLIAALKDKSPEVRRLAAEALGEIKDARAVEPLIAALKDKDLHVGWEAAKALTEMGQHIITERKRYRWGQYNVVMYYHVEDWVQVQVQIQDRRGEVLREIWSSGKMLEDDNFVELTGGGTPELHIQTYSGGAHCCYVDYYFTQDGGLRNLLIFLGSNSAIYEVKDLNGDGRPELIANNDTLAYFDDLSHGSSPYMTMVIGWDGKRYVDQTRRYPALARQEARKYQTELLEDPIDYSLRSVALGYYAISLVIGEGQAARAWLLKHADKETKEWLLSNEEELRRQLAKTCKVGVSQNQVLDFGGYECACEPPQSNDCPGGYAEKVWEKKERLQKDERTNE